MPKKKKLLYIAPHLSTGGLPQYLTKKIEFLKDEFEIYLIEWENCTGGKLIVQRDKILNLIDSTKFYEFGENKYELFNIIEDISPDIIHLEEIPEYFMEDNIAEELYSKNRNYFLVETSHDSSFDTSSKRFFPDKFMFVSNWQIDQYTNVDIPKILVEYPIEYIPRPDRDTALKRLNLDPSKKHILHVALYTSRKNQKEFFEYAKSLPEYEFHSVGNQADNFKWYWEPLMKDIPPNLTWWGERSDVESFYQSMDLFLFTSRGNKNDKETMPLVIREALSYQLPQLLYNLEVYQNYFDGYDSIDYLDFNSFDNNIKKIKSNFKEVKDVNEEEEAYVVCTYPNTQANIDTTIECVKALRKDSNRKIIISSHYPVPKELQDMVDYVFYEKNNPLTKHTFYEGYSFYNNQFDTYVNLRGEDNDIYHGPACYTLFYNPATFAKGLGIEKLYYVNFDYILKDQSYINYISKKLNTYNTFFGEHKAQEGKCYYTYFFGAKPEAILNHCNFIETGNQYDNLMGKCEAESNGLENLYYHLFKNNKQNYIEPKEKFEKDAEKYFEFKDYSRVEYYTILPTDVDNHFCPWITISNANESKNIHYTVEKNGELIIDRLLEIRGKFTFWDLVKYNLEDNFKVIFDVRDAVTGETIKYHQFDLNEDYFLNIMPKNGSFKWKDDRSKYLPKIKLIHLVTDPKNNDKEIKSLESLKDFCKHTNIKYEQRINKIWKDIPPKETCNRPDDIQSKPGYYKLAPGHYGCFLAHTNAICSKDNYEYDYVLIFEGDVIIDSDYQELYDSLIRFSRISKEQDQDLIGFGNPHQKRNLNGPKIEDIYTNVTPFIPAQSYLINREKLDKINKAIKTTKWDAFDMWVCNVAQLKVGTAEKIYTKHLPGFSIIDQEYKSIDENSPEIWKKL